jgi:hypothetical protein
VLDKRDGVNGRIFGWAGIWGRRLWCATSL